MKKFKELKLMVEEKKDKYDEGEYDQEGDMAKSDLRSIMANAKELHDMIDDADNLPEWCQNKITLAEDYISTVANYLTAEMSEEVQSGEEQHKEIDTHTEVEDGSHQDKNDTKDLHDRIKAAAKKHGATITYQDKPSLRGSHTISGRGSQDFHKEVKHIASDYEHLGVQHDINEEVSKADVPAYLRKQKGEKPLTMSDVKAPRKDSISAKENLAKARNEEVEQIDEKNVPTSPEKWAQAKSQAKAKFDVYPSAYANGWAAKKYKAMGGSWKSVSEATEPPFDKPYTTVKKVVTDKSGAKHSPMSRARDIARMAMKKQMEKMKPVKESLEESRKAEIVKEIMKKKKDKSEDAFQKDPELTTTLAKGI